MLGSSCSLARAFRNQRSVPFFKHQDVKSFIIDQKDRMGAKDLNVITDSSVQDRSVVPEKGDVLNSRDSDISITLNCSTSSRRILISQFFLLPPPFPHPQPHQRKRIFVREKKSCLHSFFLCLFLQIFNSKNNRGHSSTGTYMIYACSSASVIGSAILSSAT